MKSQFSETEDYTNSVNENGGFYIGRYEASENNGVTEVKPNKSSRNNISQTDALAKANSMYASGEFTSSLLTGSAWDRTLGWLEETEAVSSIEIVGDSKIGEIIQMMNLKIQKVYKILVQYHKQKKIIYLIWQEM